MKKAIFTIGVTIFLLAVFTWLTAKIETPVDGNDSYGFPLTFYKIYGGKREYYTPSEFSIWKFIVDIFIVYLIALASITIFGLYDVLCG